ncbi:MAG: hypothetical protein E6R03_04940 [Hyphomicrobiaceae bacterium]|nr:MAG: hypothetical protein E6R03_04940 [Hyphomicrobiaceae bacterium]
MKVLIIGAGPAGRMAAHAAAMAGAMFHIVAPDDGPHLLHGAQYLHEEIDGVDCGDPFDIEYIKLGTEEVYRQRVYEGVADPPTSSWNSYSGVVPGYDLRRVYSRLRKMYPITRMDPFDRSGLETMLDFSTWDLVVFTGNRPAVMTGETYVSTTIEASISTGVQGQNRIEYFGVDYPNVPLRSSLIEGHSTMEWPDSQGAFLGRHRLVKPVRVENPDPLSEHPRLLLAGRMGKWDKNVLVHHVYEEVYGACV